MRLTELPIFRSALAIAAMALVSFSASGAGAQPDDSARVYAHACRWRFVVVTSAKVKPGLPFFVCDVDGDGNEDLILNGENSLLWYRFQGSALTLVREYVYEHPGSTQMVTDADGDGRPEFFVFMETSEGWMLSCYDFVPPGEPSAPAYTVGPLYPLTADVGNPTRKTKYFGSFACPDGCRRMILVGSNPSPKEGDRRSLHAYDGATGRKLWRFDFGPLSWEVACDSFGSPTPRVVLTTIANKTGISANGTSDYDCYLFCLDQRNGDLLWKKKLGGIGGRAYVEAWDFNGDGRNEICVFRSLGERDSVLVTDPRAWDVAALNGDGEVLTGVHLPIRPGPVSVADLDGDSSLEILIDATGGRLAILNRELTLREIINPSPSGLASYAEVYGVRDLVGKGGPEIVSWLDKALVVRSREGSIIARSPYPRQPLARFITCEGKDYVAVAQRDSIHIMTLQELPITTRLRAQSRRLAMGAIVAVLIGVWATFHARRLLRRRRERRMDFDAEQNELLTAMSAFGHGGSSLKVLDRLRLHLKNWERIRAEGATKEELFARLHQTFRETVMPELERLVMLARKARTPEASWSTLLAEAKIADEAILEILASGADPGRQKDHIAEALTALDSVDESIAGIRSYLRSVFRTSLAEALDRLVARFRFEQGDGGVSFVLAPEAAAGAVYISPVSFDKVFEAIISNAARATEGKTDAEVAVTTRTEGNYCQVEVRDNGCGIAREDWERVFDRHYTTKTEGGGFGLYYAREELAKFGGKIFVADSVVGSGTTIRAVLRKSEKAGDG